VKPLPRRPRLSRRTTETRRVVDDAAAAGHSLIYLARPHAGARATGDRPHRLAVQLIALRQVLDGDHCHGNLLGGAAQIACWRALPREIPSNECHASSAAPEGAIGSYCNASPTRPRCRPLPAVLA